MPIGKSRCLLLAQLECPVANVTVFAAWGRAQEARSRGKRRLCESCLPFHLLACSCPSSAIDRRSQTGRKTSSSSSSQAHDSYVVTAAALALPSFCPSISKYPVAHSVGTFAVATFGIRESSAHACVRNDASINRPRRTSVVSTKSCTTRWIGRECTFRGVFSHVPNVNSLSSQHWDNRKRWCTVPQSLSVAETQKDALDEQNSAYTTRTP